MAVTNISRPKTLAAEDEHQLYLDLANLLPAKAMGLRSISPLNYMGLARRAAIDQALADKGGPLVSRLHDPSVALPMALQEHFAGEEFAAFRRYLLEPDPRWPALETPKQRWNFLVLVSEELYRRVGYRTDLPMVRWFRAKMEMWKPDRACVICDKLFSVTRKDKTTCSDKCASVSRQRDYQERKNLGIAKQYAAAKKKASKQRKGR
jgi:predicted nucleic acid-binding Zn ribbon protein